MVNRLQRVARNHPVSFQFCQYKRFCRQFQFIQKNRVAAANSIAMQPERSGAAGAKAGIDCNKILIASLIGFSYFLKMNQNHFFAIDEGVRLACEQLIDLHRK